MEEFHDNLRPRFKLWLSSDEAEGVFGDGKWRLLCAIEQHGSLRAAASQLGISYRKAWGDMQKAETYLGVKLTEKKRGGSKGGETLITDIGKQWIQAYGDMRHKVEEVIHQEFNARIPKINGKKRES
jgi:molybdate transport system regulatory protein